MENNNSMISIIMPVYNSEKYVLEAIKSVCRQSYKNWELLIINDGSTDNSGQIIEEYGQKDSRIKVFHRENQGVSKTRNFALNQISGEYVTFIDSDDIYHIDRLKRMIKVFGKCKDCDIVFARHMEFKGELRITNETNLGKIQIHDDDILKKVISDSSKHFVWNAMIRSDIAKIEEFESIRFAEDFCYMRDCANHCQKIVDLDDVLYYYRRDNENAMTSHFFTEKYIVDYMRLVENIYHFLQKNELNDDFYKKMLAHEYAQNSMRIRKCTSYAKFIACMNDKKFRKGIDFADATQCSFFEKCLFFLVKHKIYVPFRFWIW